MVSGEKVAEFILDIHGIIDELHALKEAKWQPHPHAESVPTLSEIPSQKSVWRMIIESFDSMNLSVEQCRSIWASVSEEALVYEDGVFRSSYLKDFEDFEGPDSVIRISDRSVDETEIVRTMARNVVLLHCEHLANTIMYPTRTP